MKTIYKSIGSGKTTELIEYTENFLQSQNIIIVTNRCDVIRVKKMIRRMGIKTVKDVMTFNDYLDKWFYVGQLYTKTLLFFDDIDRILSSFTRHNIMAITITNQETTK